MDILIDVFLRCSVPVFVNYVRTLRDFNRSNIATPEKYRELGIASFATFLPTHKKQKIHRGGYY